MTDYIINIGTKFDSTGMLQYQRAQRDVGTETGKTNTQTKDQTTALNNNARAANTAATAVNKYGMSQKATAAAMRGVPAQITDIFVSLQGGQRPLTVLLQQGGQLKDMFGGIRPAAAALSRSLVGLINPWTVLAAVVGSAAVAFVAGQREMESINQQLIITGRQAGITAGDVQTMAVEFDNMRGVTQGYATEMANAVVSTRKFSGDSIKAVTELALVLEQVTGGELEDLIKQVSSLGDNPVKAALELNDAFLVLTDTQIKEIKAARDAGDQKKATQLAAEALTQGLKGLNEELIANEGYWDKSTGAMGRWFAELWDGFKGIGRETTDELKLVELRAKRLGIEESMRREQEAGLKGWVKYREIELSAVDKDIKAITDRTAAKEAEDKKTLALRQSTQALAVAQEAHWDATATKAQKAQREIDAVRAKYKQMLADSGGDAGAAARIEEAQQLEIENIQKKYEEKQHKRVDRSLERLKERQQRYLADLKDMYDQSQTDLTNIAMSDNIMNKADNSQAGQRRIALLEAESKAYERAGFVMSGYVKVADDAQVASIQMTQRKALELGIIKNINQEIDESSPLYQQATKAAREYADTEVDVEKARQQFANNMYMKQMNDDLQMQIKELGLMHDLLNKGIVPDSREWNHAMIGVNEEMLRAQMLAQGIDLGKIDEFIDKWKEAQAKMLNNDETKENLKLFEQQFSSVFDAIWDNGMKGLQDWIVKAARELAKSQLLKMMSNSGNGWMQAIGSIFGGAQANGGAWNNGVQMFANGGVVNGATPFGMAGGRMGVMGEAGPEAIMPLKRGKNGKMGVQMDGAGGTSIQNNITINSSGDNQADLVALSKAVDQMLDTKMQRYMRDQQRTGNSLSTAFKQRY